MGPNLTHRNNKIHPMPISQITDFIWNGLKWKKLYREDFSIRECNVTIRECKITCFRVWEHSDAVPWHAISLPNATQILSSLDTWSLATGCILLAILFVAKVKNLFQDQHERAIWICIRWYNAPKWGGLYTRPQRQQQRKLCTNSS